MNAAIKAGLTAIAVIVVQVAAVLTIQAAVSPAQAEMISFWEDGKPSVTGTSRRATAKHRLPAASAGNDSDNDNDAPAARPRKSKRVASRVDADDESAPRKKQRKVRVASLGGDDNYDPRPTRKSLSGGGNVTWAASSSCLNGTLTSIVQDVASQYGALTVSSTCRDHGHNAAVGGAKKSQHLTGDAVDFRVHGNASGAMAFLRNHGSVGGFHHYGGGLFHIDTGPKRTW